MAKLYIRNNKNVFNRESIFEDPVTFEEDLTFSGEAQPYTKEIVLGPQDFIQVSAKPDIDAADNEYLFDKTADETLIANIRMPDDWLGDEINVCVKWAQAAAGVVMWNLGTKLWMDGSTPGEAYADTSITKTDEWTAGVDFVSSEEEVTISSAGPGLNMKLRLSRDADNVADTYDADARFIALVIEYHADRFGRSLA